MIRFCLLCFLRGANHEWMLINHVCSVRARMQKWTISPRWVHTRPSVLKWSARSKCWSWRIHWRRSATSWPPFASPTTHWTRRRWSECPHSCSLPTTHTHSHTPSICIPTLTTLPHKSTSNKLAWESLNDSTFSWCNSSQVTIPLPSPANHMVCPKWVACVHNSSSQLLNIILHFQISILDGRK